MFLVFDFAALRDSPCAASCAGMFPRRPVPVQFCLRDPAQADLGRRSSLFSFSLSSPLPGTRLFTVCLRQK